MDKPNKSKLIKTARYFLEMKGFKIKEQSWTMSRYKIDFITEKDDTTYFIDINPINSDTLSEDYLTQTKTDNIKAIFEVWQGLTKYSGKLEYASISILIPDYVVLGFYELNFKK